MRKALSCLAVLSSFIVPVNAAVEFNDKADINLAAIVERKSVKGKKRGERDLRSAAATQKHGYAALRSREFQQSPRRDQTRSNDGDCNSVRCSW
jgi:hypothetical protein